MSTRTIFTQADIEASFPNVQQYASDPRFAILVSPPDELWRAKGLEPYQGLPAHWWNFYIHWLTARLNTLHQAWMDINGMLQDRVDRNATEVRIQTAHAYDGVTTRINQMNSQYASQESTTQTNVNSYETAKKNQVAGYKNAVVTEANKIATTETAKENECTTVKNNHNTAVENKKTPFTTKITNATSAFKTRFDKIISDYTAALKTAYDNYVKAVDKQKTDWITAFNTTKTTHLTALNKLKTDDVTAYKNLISAAKTAMQKQLTDARLVPADNTSKDKITAYTNQSDKFEYKISSTSIQHLKGTGTVVWGVYLKNTHKYCKATVNMTVTYGLTNSWINLNNTTLIANSAEFTSVTVTKTNYVINPCTIVELATPSYDWTSEVKVNGGGGGKITMTPTISYNITSLKWSLA